MKQVIRCKQCDNIIRYRNQKDREYGTYTCGFCKKKHTNDVYFSELKKDFSARKKRSMIQQEVWTPQQLLEVIEYLKNTRDKAMIAFLYLTGSRISEVVGIRKPLKKITDIEKETMKIQGKRMRKRRKSEIEYIIEPVRKDKIILKEYNGIQYIEIIGLPVLKKRDQTKSYDLNFNEIVQTATKRSVPIILEGFDKQLWKYVQEYIDTIGNRSYLFPITYQRAYQITRENLGVFNHFFRHCRASHLKMYKDFDSTDLKQFFSWSDEKMGSVYAHLNSQSILKKMIASKKNYVQNITNEESGH